MSKEFDEFIVPLLHYIECQDHIIKRFLKINADDKDKANLIIDNDKLDKKLLKILAATQTEDIEDFNEFIVPLLDHIHFQSLLLRRLIKSSADPKEEANIMEDLRSKIDIHLLDLVENIIKECQESDKEEL